MKARILVMTPLFWAACVTHPPGKPAPASPPAPQASISGAGAPGADALKVVEAQLARVRSDKVTVSAKLLRALVHDEETLRGQCRDLSTQLEALKNIDLQQAEATQ